jgi:hypothetical protein
MLRSIIITTIRPTTEVSDGKFIPGWIDRVGMLNDSQMAIQV